MRHPLRCGTFSAAENNGGCDGSLQFEKNRPDNSGLQTTIDFYLNLVRRFGVSFADAAVYGGIVAIQECGGPNIPFKFGRIDVAQADPEGRLPGPAISAQEIFDTFVTRMGFSLDETVALVGGGHTIGRVHAENTLGVNPGPMDTTENKFDNLFFQNLLVQTPPGGITRLVADGNMESDSRMKPLVEKFASDNDAFISAFVSAYTKMSDLGAQFDPNQNKTVPNGRTMIYVHFFCNIHIDTGNGNNVTNSSGNQEPSNSTNSGGQVPGASNGLQVTPSNNGTTPAEANNGTTTGNNTVLGSNDGNNGTTPSETLPPLTQPASVMNPSQVPTPTFAPPSNGGPVIPVSPPGAPVVGVPVSPPSGAIGQSAGNPRTDGSSFFAEIAASLLMLAPLLWI